MEGKRAQTLEALTTFIQSQRLLLSRVQSDIERLRELRGDAIAEPERFVSNLSNELGSQTFKLSQQLDVASSPPEQIDWSLYAYHDPTPLRTLALNARIAYAQRNQPRVTQLSELSDLQKLVKEARREIVDPVLANLAFSSDSDEEEGLDPEELERERERAKIRELKKRRISCGLTISLHSRAPDGVFIRRDLEDESAEVDISLDGDHESNDTVLTTNFAPMDVDVKNGLGHESPHPPNPPLAKSSRNRRPTSKLQASRSSYDSSSLVNGVRRKSTATVAKIEKDHDIQDAEKGTKTEVAKRTKDTGKPKSETYKQSWSMSEQHLLERLLEEIPEGEKNRWQKISRAMMGRRTPRQVASRVQKYFEKLKRFGVANSIGDGILLPP